MADSCHAALNSAQNALRMATFNDVYGEDTPETVKPHTPPQHFGPEASAFTKAACAGKEVRLELVEGNTRDKYNRLLAIEEATGLPLCPLP